MLSLPLNLDEDMAGATVKTDRSSNSPLELSSLAKGRSWSISFTRDHPEVKSLPPNQTQGPCDMIAGLRRDRRYVQARAFRAIHH